MTLVLMIMKVKWWQIRWWKWWRELTLMCAGLQGDRGVAGAIGPNGATGSSGGPGPAGPEGQSGQPGSRGVRGPPGPQGLIGPSGPVGPQGTTGKLLSSLLGHLVLVNYVILHRSVWLACTGADWLTRCLICNSHDCVWIGLSLFWLSTVSVCCCAL